MTTDQSIHLEEETTIPIKKAQNLDDNPSIIERLIINFLEPIDQPFGMFLRKHIYKALFGVAGKNIYIQSNVDILNAKNIFIGNDIKILRYTILNLKNKNSWLKLNHSVCLDRGVDIRAGGENCNIEIGQKSYLGPNVCIAGPGDIKIGSRCLIASMVGIYANQHHHVGTSRKGIVIEDKCWLGSGAKVMDGVTIGYGSVIGAGAVVTRDIPPYSIAVGVPAKVLEDRRSQTE